MKKYSLYTIIFTTLAILTAVSIGSVFFFANQHRHDLIDTAQNEKIGLVKMIDDVLSSPRYLYEMAKAPGLERLLVTELATFKDVRFLRIVTNDGVIYSSNLDEDWDQSIKEPLLKRAVATKTIQIKDDLFRKEKIKLIIYPGSGGKNLMIGFSLANIEKTVSGMFRRDIITILGGLLLTYLVIFLMLKQSIIEPLKRIIIVCKAVKQGNLSSNIKVKSKTEIGELSAAFNSMIDNLKQSRQALEKSKANLEVKVAERTEELKKLTDSLDEQVKRKTKELYQKVAELERFNRLAVGRELRMVELKKEIDKLRQVCK